MMTPLLPDMPLHLWRIWAKWSKAGRDAPTEGETFHPLICHMLDVATVARHLWGSVLPVSTRARLTRHLGLGNESVTAAWIALWAGLHDIGKASPGFQQQLNDSSVGEAIRVWMREAGLNVTGAEWVAHGSVSAYVLVGYLGQLGIHEQLAEQIATLVGGHHGIFPRQGELNALKDRQQVGTGSWDTVREQLVAALYMGLKVPNLAPTGTLTPADAVVFAGLVSVADWIGSNEDHFPHAGRLAATPHPLSVTVYAAGAEIAASEALQSVRMDAFIGDTNLRSHRTFGDLFPKTPDPRDAQKAIIELAANLTGPALVILEAPMGEGKTEAALYLADAWATTQGRHGAYIALPTQATSNSMFGRVREYLTLRFADTDYVTAHLVYGEALLNDDFVQMLNQGRTVLRAAHPAPVEVLEFSGDKVNGEDFAMQTGNAIESLHADKLLPINEGPVYDGRGEEGSIDGTVVAIEWFAAPKRALLAPFGVGTIDQALLGVLQTKHFFVRLFGLIGKTVIVDEVHAYDTYMSALLDRLLEWLGAFGVPVVLLSATLPQSKRVQLQSAYARYTGWNICDTSSDALEYPRLTWVSEAGIGARTVTTSPDMSRTVLVEWLDDAAPESAEGLAALGERLHTALTNGGCAAVVCNTVGRAQAVYTALQQYFPGIASDGLPVLDLFHARFLRTSRAEREARVLGRFAKGEGVKRPHRAVLIATQVIEQSLDLDFDLMVSDLAPVDLLLQRSGRLHRHRLNDSTRPKAVAAPRLLIPRPDERDGCPQFSISDEFIYDPHVLLRTWCALEQQTEIRVPEGMDDLIRQVYDAAVVCPESMPPAVHIAWEETRLAYEHSIEEQRNEARVRRVPPPKDEAVFRGRNLKLKEVDEAPYADETALALTRLGPPSVRVVVLPAQSALREREMKGGPPDINTVRTLLNQSVSISHGAVAPALIQQEPPAQWRKSPWLRHTRLVALDDSGQATVATHGKEGTSPRFYTLRLDPDLGVVIKRQANEER